ncbi:NAD(P)H-dependent oxidoreductase [Mangrovimonas sp. AS39]|uniref:NADPH-dependent FMN reductase n=1 Tax=Mangrovimonas futianensis TaxID=2895523 RepID=UPI001E62ECA1|nr:NADPH-dependent FMN reductase [Mangrovimonas futianensis]MCF1192222.1 NAD(P)H-dependent oxidoreductase [Mangrovimonas futianensis]MCF1196029.1 NAD(P)H-dependent oxidoreductase [Mangrovimonas futianensis]
MKVLIFNGALERRENATSERLTRYLYEQLQKQGVVVTVFKMADSGIPLFDVSLQNTPKSVELMNHIFRDADVHIWITPLYHGSMTGVMKNCLDWLQYSANMPKPYLTGKLVGLMCWADGVQAMQGINAMDSVAKALRAWTAPLSIPIQRSELFNEEGEISDKYGKRVNMLIDLLLQSSFNRA